MSRIRRWWRRLWSRPPIVIRIQTQTWDPSKMDDPATAHEPQVIEGYVDPSGRGERNWSSEK